MNTRLQVEHPVTEMITGLDLVEWQIRVAAGEPLPCEQSDIALRGHAIEARLYAEDPGRDFLPSSGAIAHLRFPEGGEAVRVDSGVRQGDTVSRHYDAMLAKLIVWSEDRSGALSLLRDSIGETEVVGLATNRAYLAAVARHAAFGSGDHDTSFVEEHGEALLSEAELSLVNALALASLAEIGHDSRPGPAAADGEGDPHSPWGRRDGWRLFGRGAMVLRFRGGTGHSIVRAMAADGGYELSLPDRAVHAAGRAAGDGAVEVSIDGEAISGRVYRVGDERHIVLGDRSRVLVFESPDSAVSPREAGAGKLTAPLPATVVAVHASAGQKVRRGEALMVLEAMKMEHVVAAPDDGTIATVHYASGDQVVEGAELIVFESN
jgi:3-methylcrotonyl-CoA carboxylase alpha subunit